MSNFKSERTLILIKPDGVERGLVGEIIKRIEETGLKIIGLEMVRADKAVLEKHYPASADFISILGRKTLEIYGKLGLDPIKTIGIDNPTEIGKLVREWLIKFILSGPIVKMAVEGPHAVQIVRKLVGNTMPLDAAPGTIRGDFSVDSAAFANAERRPVKNLIHASGTIQEAEQEITLWFKNIGPLTA